MRTQVRKLGLAAAAATALAAGASSAAKACDITPYLGDICVVPYSFCQRGYQEANGQLLAISEYPNLFQLIRTTYGGDGRTTFALPDLRGRAALGSGRGPGQPVYAPGETGGANETVLNALQMPAHTHGVRDLPVTATATLHGTGRDADATSPAGALLATPRGATYHSPVGAGLTAPMAGNAIAVSGSTGSGTSGSVGTSAPIDNRQPFLALRYCIAVQGIFPPRS